jgi:hypothetical protein
MAYTGRWTIKGEKVEKEEKMRQLKDLNSGDEVAGRATAGAGQPLKYQIGCRASW